MTIGAATPRIDGVDKVTGAAKFTGDLTFADLLEAKVLRSPLPHARIVSIDTRKVAALPGVVAILTRDDLQDIDPYYGNCLRDRAVVATDKGRAGGAPGAGGGGGRGGGDGEGPFCRRAGGGGRCGKRFDRRRGAGAD